MADEPTRRERIYSAIQEILADEGEVLTGFVLIAEWDNAKQPKYLSRTSGDPIGRPLSVHGYIGLVAAAGDIAGWPEETMDGEPVEEETE